MIHFSMDTKAGQTLFYMIAVLTERIDGLKLSEHTSVKCVYPKLIPVLVESTALAPYALVSSALVSGSPFKHHHRVPLP